MAKVSENELANLLNMVNRQLRLLVLAGELERPTVQADGSIKFDTTDTNIAAALAKAPKARRADGIPSANESAAEIAARVGRATQ
jgi:hypothetical protein